MFFSEGFTCIWFQLVTPQQVAPSETQLWFTGSVTERGIITHSILWVARFQCDTFYASSLRFQIRHVKAIGPACGACAMRIPRRSALTVSAPSTLWRAPLWVLHPGSVCSPGTRCLRVHAHTVVRWKTVHRVFCVFEAKCKKKMLIYFNIVFELEYRRYFKSEKKPVFIYSCRLRLRLRLRLRQYTYYRRISKLWGIVDIFSMQFPADFYDLTDCPLKGDDSCWKLWTTS